MIDMALQPFDWARLNPLGTMVDNQYVIMVQPTSVLCVPQSYQCVFYTRLLKLMDDKNLLLKDEQSRKIFQSLLIIDLTIIVTWHLFNYTPIEEIYTSQAHGFWTLGNWKIEEAELLYTLWQPTLRNYIIYTHIRSQLTGGDAQLGGCGIWG